MINKKYRLNFFLLISATLLFLFYCGKDEVPKSTLIVRDNLLYKQGSNIPYTGRERALVDNKIIEYEVKDGLKHGDFRLFSKEGIVEIQGQIDSNRNVGKWQYFYNNGAIESEGHFVYDLPEGLWTWNYPDGTKKEEGYYKKGKRIGLWHGYDKNGKVIFEKNYDLADSSAVDDKDY